MHKLFMGLFLAITAFTNAQTWETDFETAKALAMEQDRNIIVVFQGSDWCAPCRKLENNIWSSEEFINYANENVILLKVDFPKRKKNKLSKEQQEKNNLMAEKFNPEGFFPEIVVLDKYGKKRGRTGYKRFSPKEYIRLLSAF